MKKVIVFSLFLAIATHLKSQVVLVNPCDNLEYKDGSTMVITPEIYEEGEPGTADYYCEVTFHAPVIKNNGSSAVNVYADYDITEMPHGAFQDCIGGSCKSYNKTGHYTSAVANVAGKGTATTLMEWNCMSTKTFDYEPGTCTIKLDLYVNSKKESSYTIKYVYEKTEGVNTVTNSEKKATRTYDLQGRTVKGAAKGLLIMNGKKVLR